MPSARLRRTKQLSLSFDFVARSGVIPSPRKGGGPGACGVLDRTRQLLRKPLDPWLGPWGSLTLRAKGLDGRCDPETDAIDCTVSMRTRFWCRATPETACWNSALTSSRSTRLSLVEKSLTKSSSSSLWDRMIGLAVPLAGTGAIKRGPVLLDCVGAPKAAERLPASVLVSTLPQLVRRAFQVAAVLGTALPEPRGDFDRENCGEMARAIKLAERDGGATMGGLCARAGHRLSSLRSSAQSPSGITWHLGSNVTCLMLAGDAVRADVKGASVIVLYYRMLLRCSARARMYVCGCGDAELQSLAWLGSDRPESTKIRTVLSSKPNRR